MVCVPRYKESYKTMKQFEGNENPLAVAKDGEVGCGFAVYGWGFRV